MPKVKKLFLVNIYFIYRYSEIKRLGNAAFFVKLEAFNCKVSCYRLTLYNSYRHFMPEVRGKELLLKLI